MIKLKELLNETIDLEKYGVHYLSQRGAYDIISIPTELFKSTIKELISSKKIKTWKDVPGCDKGYLEHDDDGYVEVFIDKQISNQVMETIRETIVKSTKK